MSNEDYWAHQFYSTPNKDYWAHQLMYFTSLREGGEGGNKRPYVIETRGPAYWLEVPEPCPNLEFEDHCEETCPYHCFNGELAPDDEPEEERPQVLQDDLFGEGEEEPPPDEAECSFNFFSTGPPRGGGK